MGGFMSATTAAAASVGGIWLLGWCYNTKLSTEKLEIIKVFAT